MKFLYKDSSLLDESLITETSQKLSEYIKHLNEVAKKNNYEDDEASINLPFDESLFQKISDLKGKKVSSKLKYLVIIGIGGSNLGTKAVYDALFGFYDILQPSRYPKMIFLDTQDEEILAKTIELINSLGSKDEILVNVISKSGGTTETAANLEIIYDAVTKKFTDSNDRFVITTDEGSKMQLAAEKKQIDVLNLPQKVGGRYSVFSAVGMFPFAAIGFNIEAIRRGAKHMRDIALQENDNLAVISAVILYLHYKNGKNINDNFIFLPHVESLGKWYRQLLGESIGKDGKGITPTVSIGSTDLHSVGQLYLGGPQDKITTFIYGENTKYEATIPQNTVFNLVDAIRGKNINEIMRAIIGGVKIAYQKRQIPYIEVILDTVNEESLAQFMQFKMMEMMYLGRLMGVNAFNQPQVELYKEETRKILNK